MLQKRPSSLCAFPPLSADFSANNPRVDKLSWQIKITKRKNRIAGYLFTKAFQSQLGGVSRRQKLRCKMNENNIQSNFKAYILARSTLQWYYTKIGLV